MRGSRKEGTTAHWENMHLSTGGTESVSMSSKSTEGNDEKKVNVLCSTSISETAFPVLKVRLRIGGTMEQVGRRRGVEEKEYELRKRSREEEKDVRRRANELRPPQSA
jgi:hypothetical protein